MDPKTIIDTIRIKNIEGNYDIIYVCGDIPEFNENKCISDLDKLNKELDYYIKFNEKLDFKLSNEKFINNAPKDIIDKETNKYMDNCYKIIQLEYDKLDLEISLIYKNNIKNSLNG